MFLRKFIIMSKQSSKDAKGHAKLEVRGTKGRLSLSLEEMQFNENINYELSSLTDEKSGFKEVILGMADVNKSGRGRLELNFNPNTVGESQIPISELNILLLKEINTEQNEVQIILGGYIHEDDNSMSKSLKHIKGLPKSRNKIIKQEVDIKTEKTEPEIEEIEEIKEIKEVEKEKKIKEIEKEIEIEKTKEIKEKSVKREQEQKPEFKSSDIEEESEDDCTEEATEKKNHPKDYNEQVASYTLDLLKFFKEIEPFKIESKDQRWWQIDYDKTNSKIGFLPYYSYISNSPYNSNIEEDYATCQSQIRRYKKYLFGVAEHSGKITHYIYGIPGKRVKSEHPYGGSTGFVTWLEDKDGEGRGYWLSYIDAHTGNIVKPI